MLFLVQLLCNVYMCHYVLFIFRQFSVFVSLLLMCSLCVVSGYQPISDTCIYPTV